MEDHKSPISFSPEKYESAVRKYAELGKPKWFANKGPDYAALCASEIIRHTQEKLYIFSDSLNQAVADRPVVLEALKDAIDRKVEICLILETPQARITKPSQALQAVLDAEDGKRVRVKDLADCDGFRNAVMKQFQGNLHHLLVGDDRMIRIETDIISYKAAVNFNDPEYVSRIIKLFSNVC